MTVPKVNNVRSAGINWRTLLLAWLALASAQVACAQANRREPTSLTPKWKVEATAADRHHAFSALGVCPSKECLVAVDASSDVQTKESVALTLWRVDDGGNVLKTRTISEYPPGVTGSSSSIAASTVLPAGETIVVGDVDGSRRAKAAKLHADETPAWSMDLLSNQLSRPRDILRRADGTFVIVGAFQGDAAAVRMDAHGQILWSRLYDRGQQEEFWSAASLSGDSAIYVAGTSGETNEFGIGPLNVWLAKINENDGSVEEEKAFRGRFPRIAANSQQQLIAVYDTSQALESSCVVAAFSTAFEEKWTTPIAVTKFWSTLPALAISPNDSVFVAGRLPASLHIQRLSSAGTVIADGSYEMEQGLHQVQIGVLKKHVVIATEEKSRGDEKVSRGVILAFDIADLQ